MRQPVKRMLRAATATAAQRTTALTNSCCYSRGLYNATALNANDTDVGRHKFAAPELAPNDARIIVIGAGLAGLSAANHLIKHGFHRTLILEATDRYGGRINTKHFGDTYCELGAKWVNIDGSHFSMYELLRTATGLKKQIKQPGRIAYVHTQGRAVHANMTTQIDRLFQQLCRNFQLSDCVKSGSELQALDNVMTYFRAESAKLSAVTFKPEEQRVASEIFDSLFKEFGSLLGCCLEYVNIAHINKLPAADMQPIYVPTGLDCILQRIVANIAPAQLQTGKPVGRIQWQTLSEPGSKYTILGAMPGSVNIEPQAVGCLDGSVYRAEHIICTLPLGVLKNFSNIMFKPTLPKAKLEAIRNLGFGNPVKIYLEYTQPIANWLTVDLRPLPGALPQRLERVWTQQVVEITRVPSSQHVLEIKVGGGYYDEIEKLPDVKLLEEVTQLLRLCLLNDEVPYPCALLRSNWSSSACYLGGRPYFATGSTVHDVQQLARPLGSSMIPTLLFAGDATIVHGFGTIDGARASGIREAQRIIDYYQRELHK